MKQISICIPTYEMRGKGAEFLRFSLDKLTRQTFKNFDVVVSDQSVGDEIQKVCAEFRDTLQITYVREESKRGSSSANLNNALRRADGQIIKILLQDDFVYHDHALEEIAAAFDPNTDHWLLSASIHSKDGSTFYREFHPKYDDQISLFKNTVSSPSVLTLSKRDLIFFDENLLWYTDNDYYKRCFDRFGAPKILDSVNVVNRVGPHQVSNNITESLKEKEFRYILEKYQVPDARKRLRAYRLERLKRQAKDLAKRLFGISKS